MKIKRFIVLFIGIILLLSVISPASPSFAQSTIPAWSSATPYRVGDLVTYAGHTYKCLVAHTSQAGWEPGNAPALWQDLGVTKSVCAARFDLSTVYVGNTKVSYNGHNWTAKWWTKGEVPGANTSGVWTDNGLCETTSIIPSADSYTQAYAPTFNNGTVRGLGVSQGQMVGTAYSYLKFDLSRVWGTVKSAQLSLCGTKVSWSQDVWTALYTTSNNTWLENTITWDNEPTLVSWLSVTKVSGLAAYKWTVPVTLINQRTSQVLSFALRVDARTVGDANAVFTSKEYLGSCQPGYPTLLLQY